MTKIAEIRIMRTYETCERTRFYVILMSDEGFDMSVACHSTGSIYTNGEGLSIDEARDRALIDAHRWGDFLQLEVTPFIEDGVTFEPSMKMLPYETRRVLAARKKEKNT